MAAVTGPFKWRFEQLQTAGAGDSELKVYELSDYAAPFGRPRRDPIVTEKVKSRVQTIHYPGSKRPPTRNAFGTEWEEITLKGRWMDKVLTGAYTANQLADLWTAFLQDERQIRISWGSIIAYTGFMTELEIARESEQEIAWKMTFLIDQREGISTNVGFAPPSRSIQDDLTDINDFMNTQIPQIARFENDLSPDFFGFLLNAASLINGPSRLLNNLAGQFDSYEKATFGAIAAFRTAVTGMQTAIVGFREVTLNTGIDSILVVRNASADIAWLKYQTLMDEQTLFVLASLANMDRKAELAGRPEVTKIIVAHDGDTWESLATRGKIGLDQVGKVRDLNGAQYGDKPISGETYFLP